jgi:transcriptional regulator with XRE-family HTH domain
MGHAHIGTAIAASRATAGKKWTQHQLATKVEIGRSKLAMVESGRRQLYEEDLRKIEAALGVKFTNVELRGWYRKLTQSSPRAAIGVQVSLLPIVKSDKVTRARGRVTKSPARRRKSDKKRRRA